MNAALPTGRTGQVIAVLLLLVVLGVAWRVVAVPLMDLYELRAEELDRRNLQAAHLQALAAALPRLREEAGADRPQPAMTLGGATDAVAAATLQGNVQEMARSVGTTLDSVEILSSENVQGLRRIGLKVALNGGLSALARLLQALEQAEPPILIDDVQIHGNVTPAADKTAPSDLKLVTSFTVYAYRQAEAGTP